jgi:hypothetical protein
MTWLKDDKTKQVDIIERTDEANGTYAKKGWGHNVVFIDRADINALLVGFGIAFGDGEYTYVIYLRQP